MARIEAIFKAKRDRGERALMPFVVGGRPTLEATTALLPKLEQAGASVIEIGIPFSDPIADGPVIASAMHEALEAGTTMRGVLEAVRAARERTQAGLVAMASVSLAHRSGVETFIRRCKDAGFDGFIFPDAPLEEAGPLVAATRAQGMTASLLIAPTTSPERAAKIANASTGFVYLLARAGITGETKQAPEIGERVGALRRTTDLPIACGFGISSAEHVRQVVSHADAAIVGSALVRRLEEASRAGEDAVQAGAALCRELAGGLAGGVAGAGASG